MTRQAPDPPLGSALAWPGSTSYLSRLRRTACWCAVVAVLSAVAAVAVGAAAHSRAERLLEDGEQRLAQVVGIERPGKTTFVLLRLPGRDGQVTLRTDEGVHDASRTYPPGRTTTVWADRDEPTDLRTAGDWNTPGRILAPGLLTLLAALLLGPTAAGTALRARRLRPRLAAGRWEVAEVEQHDEQARVHLPDGRHVTVPGPPFPSSVWVLDEAPQRTAVVVLHPGPYDSRPRWLLDRARPASAAP